MRETDRTSIQRRDLLKGTLQSERPEFVHISSAVVTVRPENARRIAERIVSTLPQTEVHAVDGAKIILVLEGRSSGEVGSRLNEISAMDGVFSAALVYEQLLPLDENGAPA